MNYTKGFSVIISGLLILCLQFNLDAQDLMYSQYNKAALYTNPANAGFSSCDGRAGMNFKNTWPGVTSERQSNIYADQQLKEVRGGVGINAYNINTNSGLITESSFSAIYSYHHEIKDKQKIMIGIAPEFKQRKVDFSKLRFADQIQANRGFILPTQEPITNVPANIFNLNWGIIYQNKLSSVGIAIHNIFEPNQSLFQGSNVPLKRRYTLHCSTKFKFADREKGEHSLSPSYIYVKQDPFAQAMMGLNYRFGQFESALAYRQLVGGLSDLKAFVISAGANINHLHILYSYDYGTNTDQRISYTAHEISLIINWCLYDK